MGDLTAKQEKFCALYVELGNATHAYLQAYQAANMTHRTAQKRAGELLKNGAVAGRIAALQQDIAQKAGLTRQFVIERLMRNARICMGEERVRLAVQRTNKETKQVDVVEIEVTERDAAAANRALELLGKTEEVRLFSDRSKEDQPGGAAAGPTEEGPRETGPDHLAELAKRYRLGLAVVEGGLAKSAAKDAQ
jgi:phage terminase small subunit